MDAVALVRDEVREAVRRHGLDPVAEPDAVRALVDETVRSYRERSLDGSLPVLGEHAPAVATVYAAVAGFDLPRSSLYFASGFENFSQGLGTAALLSFLTACCRRENAATEYALLSALFAFSREIAGAASGFGAERMGYSGFFAFTALLAVPALLLLPWLHPQIQLATATPAPASANGGAPLDVD